MSEPEAQQWQFNFKPHAGSTVVRVLVTHRTLHNRYACSWSRDLQATTLPSNGIPHTKSQEQTRGACLAGCTLLAAFATTQRIDRTFRQC